MATKHQPKWDWQSRYLLSDDSLRSYTDDDIKHLADEFEISDEKQIGELRGRLEGAANVYRIYKNNHDTAPRPSEMRAAIKEIEALVTSLQDRLERMDDLTRLHFWDFEKQLHRFHMRPESTDEIITETTEHGHSVQIAPGPDRSYYVDYIGMREHFESLTILKSYCASALDNIPDDKGAQRKSEALWMWAINIRNAWIEILDRKFSITRHKGDPVSEAARFACKAFETLDEGVPKSRILTTLERVNKYKRGKGQNSEKHPPKITLHSRNSKSRHLLYFSLFILLG